MTGWTTRRMFLTSARRFKSVSNHPGLQRRSQNVELTDTHVAPGAPAASWPPSFSWGISAFSHREHPVWTDSFLRPLIICFLFLFFHVRALINTIKYSRTSRQRESNEFFIELSHFVIRFCIPISLTRVCKYTILWNRACKNNFYLSVRMNADPLILCVRLTDIYVS